MRNFLCSLMLLMATLAASTVDAIEPGLYHDPLNPGHGITVMSAPDDHLVALWFTYEPATDRDGIVLEPNQAWFITDNFQVDVLGRARVSLYQPLALFPAAGFELGPRIGVLDFGLSPAANSFRVTGRFFRWTPYCARGVLPGPLPEYCTETFNFTLLAPGS